RGWEMFQEGKQCAWHVLFFDNTFNQSTIAVELNIKGGVSKDPEPQHREAGRYGQHTGNELPDGTSLGDARDEDTNEWRPANGPCPVKDRPGTLPSGIGKGVIPQGQFRQVHQVPAS